MSSKSLMSCTNIPHPEERPAWVRLEGRKLHLPPRAQPVDAFRGVLMSGVFVVVVALMLAGCGKKNAPVPPPDQPNTFPRAYPSE